MNQDTEHSEHPNDAIHNLREEVRDLSQKVSSLTTSIEGMTEVWAAAKVGLVVVRWVAALGASCAVVWGALHGKSSS